MRRLTHFLFAIAACTLHTLPAISQQVTLLGLRAVNHAGAFHGLRHDAAGNLYTVLDAGDGIRLLKFSAGGTQLLSEAHIGGVGDSGLALDLDPSGNIYVAGTSASSGSVSGTAGTAFPNRAGTRLNSFVVRFSPQLQQQWLTFCGAEPLAVTSLAASAETVFVTGSVFSSTLPVTPNGVQQTPAPASGSNGFVESFATSSGALQYATYLSGSNGDTAPASIVASSSGTAYVVGTTTATGFPTTAALVPTFRAVDGVSASGFVTALTAGGDGFLFSTFVPGDGLTSVALDATAGSLNFSGNVAAGLFPLTRAQTPIASLLQYQTAVRLALDGSAVLSSTLLAPGTESVLTAGSNGSIWATEWVQNTANVPLLPIPSVETMGNAITVRVAQNGMVDRASRVGGLPTANSGYASIPVTEGGLTALQDGTVAVSGSVQPTLSSDLVTSQTYEFPLVNAPGEALPSAVHDALPGSDCSGSACSGSAGLLAVLASEASLPTLSLSTNDLPNVSLQNLGTTAATGLQITATGYSVTHNCGASLTPGAECNLLMSGAGPGTISVQAANAQASITQLPATSRTGRSILVSPRELDFGIVTSASSAVTRVLSVTNLGQTTQTFSSQNTSSAQSAYAVSEASSTCTPNASLTSKVLAPGGSCTITLALTASTSATNDGAVNTRWQVGTLEVLLTGYAQAGALSLSASTIDFGRQFPGGLRASRDLYVSNASDGALSHSHVTSSNPAFKITDACSSTLAPHSICHMELFYEAGKASSRDATTLSIDGQAVTVLGETLPQIAATGASANPNLSVSPSSITFSNVVAVTQASSEANAITVRSTGALPFTLTSVISGDFALQNGCPDTLGGGASCTLTTTFTPTASGTRKGLLAITAGSSSPVYVVLTGTGKSILPDDGETLSFADTPLNTPNVQWLKVSQAFPYLSVTTSDPSFEVQLVEDSGYGYGLPPAVSFSSNASGSCLNCYLGVQFRPTSGGQHTGNITLTSGGSGQPQVLTATGQGLVLTSLVLTPSAQTFDSLPVHSSSASQYFLLTNGTSSSITLSGASFTGDFASTGENTGAAPCDAGVLAAGAICVVAARFTPTQVGVRNGLLTIATSAGQATSALTGVGADDPGVAFTPGELAFRNVPGGASKQQTVTVLNTSSNSLTVGTPALSDTHFSATTACASLMPAESCSIAVTYAAGNLLSSGILSIPVTMTQSGAATTTVYTVALGGLYTTASDGLQIVPGEHNAVDFGAFATGVAALTRILHVNNVSSQLLQISTETPREFALVGSTCGTLAPGAGCDLSVRFTPLKAGTTTGTITVIGVPADGSSAKSALGYLEGYGIGGESSLTVTGDLSPTGVLNFGQVASGQTVSRVLTITNPVGAAATLTVRRFQSEQPFPSTTTCGSPLAAGQSCSITITYAPIFQATSGSSTTGTRADQGTLVIESDGSDAPRVLDLSGAVRPVFVDSPNNTTPIAAFTVSQGSLTFTSAAVGTASSSQSVTVTNTGTTSLHLQAPVLSTGFTADSVCGTLEPAATCTMRVRYVPQSAAPALGALQLQSDSNDALEFISLLGTLDTTQPPGQVQSIALSTASIDFGRILVRTTLTKLITITNTGSLPVQLGARQVGGNSSFSIPASSEGSACALSGSSLAPGASCTVAVSFTPTTTGTLRGTLSVASSATQQPLTVALSGVGTQPQLSVAPDTISFSDVIVGSTSSRAITLVNSSAVAVDGLSFTASNGFAVSSTCGITTLNANSSCALNVTFAPSVAGVTRGVLTINSTDPASPITVPLSGNGLQATGVSVSALSAAPSFLNFGNVPTGSRSTLSLVLSNPTGSVASSLLFTATPGFSVSSGCGTSLNAYSTCSVLVTFAPGLTGAVSGSLTVQNSSSTVPLTIALSGTGTATAAQLSATPGALSFGTVAVGSNSTLPVTLTNLGSVPVNAIFLSVQGGFSLAGDCGTTLNTGASCNVLVTFAPALAGATAGSLLIRSTDPTGPLVVALAGSGTLLPPRLSLTPSSFNFGAQTIGTSADLTGTVTNISNSTVVGLALTATPEFSVKSACPSTLAPGSSCPLTLTWSPTIAGAASGLLTVTSSDPASPFLASLTGIASVAAGGGTGNFSLMVSGGTSASATVQAGLPANFALTVTPNGGYTGTVALTCTADTPVTYAACSLIPSTVTLGSAQNSAVTISTVSAVSLSAARNPWDTRETIWCFTPALLLLVPKRRKAYALMAVCLSFLLTTGGCGSGGDPRIRYVAPGTYTFHVTATSTSGATLAQSVALTVTVTPR